MKKSDIGLQLITEARSNFNLKKKIQQIFRKEGDETPVGDVGYDKQNL